jgi:hypothetical protein
MEKILEISNPMVLRSAAGYYIGELCLTEHTFSDGKVSTFWLPYDRMSGYYATKFLAWATLERYI